MLLSNSPFPHQQSFKHLAGKNFKPTPKNSHPLSLMTAKSKSKSKKTLTPNPTECANPIPDIEDFSRSETLKIRSLLLRWYDENHRKLPWRKETNDGDDDEGRAYAVWVSEVMLQQTRVQTVIGYYNRWMEKWPTVQRLAAADLEEVNEMWAGLGYYRRARFLLEGAKAVVEGGNFPQTAAALRGVRGIGEYTAGAIASIAFNEAVPVVDGNVIRVITRLKAISANPKETATMKNIWKLAGQLVDPSRPGDFNQAIMELGATLCSATSPNCSSCPISDQCRALSLSSKCKKVKVTDYPTKVLKAKQRKDFAAVCVVEIADSLNSKNMYLLVKRPDEGLLAGLWEFPSILIEEEKTDMGTRRGTMDKYLKKSFGIDVGKNCDLMQRDDVGEYLHIFTHIRLRLYVEVLILNLKGGLNFFDKYQSTITWKCVDEDSIMSLGLTSSVRKVYDMTKEFKQKKISQQPKTISRKRTKRST